MPIFLSIAFHYDLLLLSGVLSVSQKNAWLALLTLRMSKRSVTIDQHAQITSPADWHEIDDLQLGHFIKIV